jgi:hypothetical protein
MAISRRFSPLAVALRAAAIGGAALLAGAGAPNAALANSALAPQAPPTTIPQSESDPNSFGQNGSYQPAGPTSTANNAFFASLGTNGRSCFSCHQPASAMSMSTSALLQLYVNSQDADPVFAPIDGANCPNTPHNHSLLLNQGVFRIALSPPAGAEFTVSVVSDPTTCNTTTAYNTNASTGAPILSVFRRPRPASNLPFAVISAADGANPTIPAVDPMTRVPLVKDTIVNNGLPDALPGQTYENGNIMADGREATLTSQAIDAVLTHMQSPTPPTAAELQQMLEFEAGMFDAQAARLVAGPLNAGGATGGPQSLSAQQAGLTATPSFPTFNEFSAWPIPGAKKLPAQMQASIARGMKIFETRPFTIENVAGFSNAPAGPNQTRGTVKGTCSTCHNELHGGNSSQPDAQFATGVGGIAPGLGGGPQPSPNLPIFKLTCSKAHPPVFATGPGSRANPPYVLTNDPGKALITGKCADIGRFTVPSLRGLSARAPYFSDGSAPLLANVIMFYDRRFKIGLSLDEYNDLLNFLRSL